MSDGDPIAIIGAGPAGLIAAEVLSAAGKRVVVYERMPSVGRKFLIAGRGGLNLTHSEDFERFITRYAEAAPHLRPMLEGLTPADLTTWAESLGQTTFVGSSGRVFPKAMKASPLLRAWLARLGAQGVTIRTRTRWMGWADDSTLLFESPHGVERVHAPAALLALGGRSWPRLGSDGAWTEILSARGINLAPLKPANVGFNVAWSDHFRERFAGQPLKTIALRFGEHEARGDLTITNYGVEGGVVYAISAPLREALANGPATLTIDLRPTMTSAEIAAKLMHARASDTLSTILRKLLHLSPVAINLLREATGGPPVGGPDALADLIKALPIKIASPRGLERAISTAGGVAWSAVDANLQLKAVPGVYVAGEMLDWEAPTGGYLLQGCFATGAWAARAILRQAGLPGTAPSLARPEGRC